MTTSAMTARSASWRRALAQNGWTLGVWLLLGGLLFWYATLIPVFGEFQITSISKNSLPLIYLAIGQAIIVIAGGIDLSLGALLLLSNVLAARFMEDQAFGSVLLIAVAMIVGLALLNALTGYVISISGVPDIVVTLATSYIWSGVALWILPSPGGGTAPELSLALHRRRVGNRWHLRHADPHDGDSGDRGICLVETQPPGPFPLCDWQR